MKRQRGMTLLELMIVVVIVGVLIAIAVFMYQRYSRAAKSSGEVAYVFGEFRLREEQYALDNNGAYLSTGTDDSDYWPDTILGDDLTDIAPQPALWSDLGMALDRTQLYCQYVAMAGEAGDADAVGAKATEFGFTAPDVNFFYLLAQCDFDKNPAINAFYFAASTADTIQRENQGH